MTTQPYDLEKYRAKREKVLGVRKRGVSFGMVAGLVSLVIVLGLGVAVIPRSLAYLQSRTLDDAIYKIDQKAETLATLAADLLEVEGVRSVETDTGRLVVTFDRTQVEGQQLQAFFDRQGVTAVLLNNVGHHARQQTLKKEAAFETP